MDKSPGFIDPAEGKPGTGTFATTHWSVVALRPGVLARSARGIGKTLPLLLGIHFTFTGHVPDDSGGYGLVEFCDLFLPPDRAVYRTPDAVVRKFHASAEVNCSAEAGFRILHRTHLIKLLEI